MASRNTASSSASISTRSKFAVELFTLGSCTRYEPSQIASRLTAASASLAKAVEELRQFSRVLSDDEFSKHVHSCSRLTQLVVDSMQEQAAKKHSFVGTKKFAAMQEAAQEYEKEAVHVASAVERSSRRAEHKAMDEKFNWPSPEDLEMRLQHLEELGASLRTAFPALTHCHCH